MNKKMILVGALLVVSTTAFAQLEKETKIEEVTIASKVPQQLQKSGKNLKLLTAKDLEKFKGQNLNEVLQQVSGFQITGNFNNNQEPKSAKIRGGKLANILVLVDGVPMKDVSGNDYSAMDLRLMALENIESIEILNGASSVLYGSNATVSVINIVTKKKSDKKIEGLLSARGGSFGNFAQNILVKGNAKGFRYQVTGFNEKSDGISSAEGENFEKDGFEKQNIAANLGYSADKFDVNLNGGWNHHFFDFDTGAFTDGTERGNDQQYYFGGNANVFYPNGQVTFNIRKSANKRLVQNLFQNHYRDEYSYEGSHFFAELFNFYQISNHINFTVGLQHEQQNLGSKAIPWGGLSMEEFLKIDDTEMKNWDAFAKFNANYKGINLEAGARFTNNSRFGNYVVYSINPYYLLENETLYYKLGYSFATAFIAPTIYQSFGTLPYLLANENLNPETNQTHEIDLSFGKKDRSIVLNASLFLRNEKNIFTYVTNPDFTGIFTNLDENQVKGFEIGVDYRLNNQLKFGGNFSFLEHNQEVIRLRQPKQRINSYLEFLPYQKTSITLSHQMVSKRKDAYWDNINYMVNNVDLDSFHLFNLNINQKIGKQFEVYAHVGNLFNTSYVDVIGFTTQPRRYTFGFSYQF